MKEKLPFELPEFKLEEIKEDNSVPLGTFKSVKTLKEAYDSLRSCFTKNAMELAEIKKNLAQKAENTENLENKQELFAKQDIDTQNSPENDKNQQAKSNLNEMRAEISNLDEQVIAQSSDKMQDIPEQNKLDKAQAPNEADKAPAPETNFWDSADWSQKAEKFFDKFPNARQHTSELAKELTKDKNLATSEDSLLVAWARVLEQNNQNIELNDDFIEKNVLNNQKIKNLIIKNYLNEIKTYKSAPSVIVSAEGTTVQSSTHFRVTDMAQARERAKKLFE